VKVLEQMLPQLKALRLSGILDTLEVRNQQAVQQKMSYLEFLGLVLHDEFERRENKKLRLRIRKANFQGDRTLETFDFNRPSLKINQGQLFDLATCRFIEEKVNCLIVGPTGVGKSHLASALGHKACRCGYDVLSMPFSRMVAQLRAGRADGSYDRKLQNFLRPNLLILDDFGLKPMVPPADEDLYELITERYERGSILITSNLDFSEWGQVFPNPVLGAAAIDRLRHEAHRVIIEGDSYRRPKPLPGEA
jgi:DNA replication protein DnaC